jgi:hypothetical protein
MDCLARSASILCALALAGCSYVIGEPGSSNAPVIHDEVEIGSLAITEIFADPIVGRSQWLELKNVSQNRVSLLTCRLRDLGENLHEIQIGSDIRIDPGEFAILARTDFIGREGELPTDFNIDGLVFADSAADETIELECPDGDGGVQIVASVTYNWDGERQRRGRSRQFTGDPTDAEALDDEHSWCEAPAQANAIFYEEKDDVEYGTPWADAVCEEANGDPPTAAGDVLITELLIGDVSGVMREWIELHNPTNRDLDVRRCLLEDSSIIDLSDVKRHTLDYETGTTVIPAGGYLHLSKTSTDIFHDLTLPEQTASYAYSTLSFTNEELQSLALICPRGTTEVIEIDWMYFDWKPYNDDFRGWSWSLSSTATDVEANDDISSWCTANPDDFLFTTTIGNDPPVVRESYGTPGAANPACPIPPRRPEVGELVITEILIDDFTGLRDWFELYNATNEDLSLVGCRLTKEDEDGTHPASPHDFDVGAGDTIIRAGEFHVLSRTDVDITADGSLVADYAYGLGTRGSFVNSRAQWLRVVCPGTVGYDVIDEILYDWGPYSAAEEGTSLVLSDDFLTAEGNDNPDHWCVAEPADIYYTDASVEPPRVARGTPGESTTVCPVPDRYPLPDEVIFTEIMGRPEFSDTEWFELKNTTSETLRLHGCRLDDIDDTPSHHVIDEEDLSIEPGEYLIFVSNHTKADTCSLPWVYDYVSISFNNSGTETIELSCPDASNPGSLLLIDTTTHEGSEFEEGIAYQVNQNGETASANDGPSGWCNADPDTVTTPFSWTCTDPSGGTTHTNYGTPGGPANCP